MEGLIFGILRYFIGQSISVNPYQVSSIVGDLIFFNLHKA